VIIRYQRHQAVPPAAQASVDKTMNDETMNEPPPQPEPNPWATRLLYGGTCLTLVGIFCSGSRNGLVIAVSQLALFGLLVRVNRAVRLTVIFSLLALVGVAAVLGIGGRSLSLAEWADDPRVRVWQIALELIGDRPWLGWGLGSYKFLYPSFPHDPEYFEIFHPHNFWLMLSAEAGIPAMLLVTALVGYLCYRAVRLLMTPQGTVTDRAILTGYLFAFWGCVAFSLFDVTLFDARLNILNWLLLSAIYVFPSLLCSQPR
jgi:O-antigen ligase